MLSSDGQLLRVDPADNTVTARPAPPGATALRAGFGALWATDFDEDTLLRIDPSTFKVTHTIPVGAGPRFLALGPDAVWVINQNGGTVSRVDPMTRKVVASVTVASKTVIGGDIAVGAGSVWARLTDHLVSRIDPSTNTVVARYGVADGSGSVAADATAIWVSAHDSDSIWRLPAG